MLLAPSTLQSQRKGQTQSRDSCRSNAQFGTNPGGHPYILSYLAKLVVPAVSGGRAPGRHKEPEAQE